MITDSGNISDWLPDLRRHCHDYAWMEQHFEALYRATAAAVDQPWLIIEAIEALEHINDYARTRRDYERWQPLLFTALDHTRIMKDEELQSCVLRLIGPDWAQYGEDELALDVLRHSGECADGWTDSPEVLLRIRIEMIKTRLRQTSGGVQESLVADVLALAAAVEDWPLLGATHQALAVYYLYCLDTPHALGHAQMAYSIWHTLGRESEMAETALTLAEIYRVGECFPHARVHLRRVYRQVKARDQDGKGSEEHRIAYSLYERGVMFLQEGEYNKAKHWLGSAKDRFADLDYPILMTAVHHSLGLVLTELAQFDEAEENLDYAMMFWERLGNQQEHANAIYARGYLEQQRGDSLWALDWYERALQACESVEETPLLVRLREKIHESIQEVSR